MKESLQAKSIMDSVETLLRRMFLEPLTLIYFGIQWVLDRLLSPRPPPPGARLHRPKIAVIGAGLTGVSSAAHCIGHGFDVTIFEAGDKNSVGGIWTKVNNTSGLQIHSLMYRFHPAVKWRKGYPDRQQIVSQVRGLWENYGLESHTKFNTKVTKVYKNEKRNCYFVNDKSNGTFDGVIVAIGTCGAPKMPHIPGMEKFSGQIHHSSRLDGQKAEGKKVIVIGGGASAVEALEFVASEGAKETAILARSEKWIIPRNAVVDAMLAMNVYGGETFMSWIPERLLRVFFYRDLQDLAPPQNGKGIFADTPMVNDEVLELVRSGKAKWLRGDIVRFEKNGVVFNRRSQGVPQGGPGQEILVEGDVVLMATGFERPSLGFLPSDCFEEGYEPPNWYLQIFPPMHVDISAINCTYVNAIGTVGNYHIGIYTRLLLMYLIDPLARPREPLMRMWIGMVQWVKSRAPGGAFDFFTYGELLWWFVFTLAINPFRWKWVLFVLFGIGRALPISVVEQEEKLRNGLGSQKA